MASFTNDFFSNINSTKSNTSSKKKKEDEDELYTSFTESFFNTTYDDNFKKNAINNTNKKYSYSDEDNVEYSEEFINEYNSFIDRMNKGTKERYEEKLNKTESKILYYGEYADDIKNERNKNLIYNWDIEKSGGIYNDYGAMPVQDKNGYLKKLDSSGNVYWVDIKNDLLYDANYKLINDNRLNDSNFLSNLKFEYNENNKIDSRSLSKSDKLGLNHIDERLYMSIVNNEKNKTPTTVEKQNYKPFSIQQPNPNEPFKMNTTATVNTDYNNLSANVYKKNFEKLNKAIADGDLSTANNAIEVINSKYFGHDYSDGIFETIFNTSNDDHKFFEKRFQRNLWDLEAINNAIKVNSNAEVLEELNKEKDRLELENTLIQYNRIIGYQSIESKKEQIKEDWSHSDESWKRTGEIWSKTFDEFDDGYDFGDFTKTMKHFVNNVFQTVGSVGATVDSTFTAFSDMAVNDLDEGIMKDYVLPKIINFASFLVPYIGEARQIAIFFEPTSVLEAGILNEESATVESSNDESRVPSGANTFGAFLNIIANAVSYATLGGIRHRLGQEGLANLYKDTGKGIATLIFKDASSEGAEEFIQTYAEVLQNSEDLSNIDWLDVTKKAGEAALIAFVLTGAASGSSIVIDGIRSGDFHETMLKYSKIDSNELNVKIDKDFSDITIDRDTDIKLNENLSDNKLLYSSTDTKGYEDINIDGKNTSDVVLDTDNNVATSIATELENNKIVTILNNSAIDTNSKIDLDSVNGVAPLSDIVIDSNTKYVLVGSKEMETYIKSLRPDTTTYVFDPNSKTFMDDIRNFVSDTAKSNIVTKNIKDFTVNDYKLSPDEMVDINNMVNEYITKANILDSVNNPKEYKLNPITTSDITDSDINTIMNSIRTKFLNEIDNNRISKESAQKEFKTLNEKISDYVLQTKENRTYLKDSKNNIIVFSKKGNNIYEAVNTMPKGTADLSVLANVKTNGNIINGNLSTKVEFTNKQLNTVNTLIDKLKLKGRYLTPDSTHKDVASLIKTNRDFSKEILQSLGADGLIEGKNKVRLYSAFDNLDNANMNQAIKNTANHLKSESFNKELDKKVKTTAPRTVDLKPEESKVSVEEKPINVKEYANNPANPSELNNIELEKLLNDSFKDLQIKNKISKDNAIELKNMIKNAIFDGYSHIVDIANTNNDYTVKKAVYDMQAVASDAQTMINGAQMKDGEIIGKALKQIYPDNNIKTKKDKELFEKIMLHALNAERENAGVDKIFENISAKQSEAIVKNAFTKHPNFKEAANDLQRYNNNLLNMLVDGGVISQDLSNKLKNRYKYYMPIYSSELSTFADLDSNKYLKQLSLDNSIKDVTKTGKQILSLEKSMENKTYNVLSAIAKNKLAQEIHNSGKYTGDSDLLFYDNGQLTKTKVSKEILSDISNNKASHIADVIHDIPVLKQLVDLSNLSYKFILDPIYQLKNITIDFTDSALIYSKDKAHFIPNYFKAIHAVANNSELFHEALTNGLGNIGEGLNAPKVSYDSNGNITTKQNKFQRTYANLEAMPKIAEYFSLKDKYITQVKKDYDAGKYNNSSEYAYTDSDGQVITFYRYHKDAKNISDNYDYNKSSVSHKTGFGIAFMDNDTYTKGKADKDIIKTTLSSKNGFLTNTDTKLENEQIDKLNAIFNEYIPDVVMFGNNITEADTINIINQASEMIANATDNNTGKKAWDEFYNSLNKDGYVLTNKDGSRTAVVKSTKQIDVLNNNTPSLESLIENAKLKAMIDASNVNLNFNRGGKVTKALSKSGFKFLNAGIQGFDKFVTHVGEGVKTPKGMGSLLLEFTAVGIGTAVANAILNGDDEEYDKLPYYYKNNYYMFKVGDNQYFRIPKGRVQAFYDVIFEYATGLREEDSPKDYFDSLMSAFDSAVLPPALESASPISAYVQLFENEDAFGNEIYSKKYDTTGEKIQKSIYHLLSNYFGRYGRIVKDVTDGDSTTDLFNEFDFYKDTTKANKHYSTALSLVDYYQNKDNIKTLDDKAMKKYIDTQNYALRSINSEINQGKKSGLSTKDLKMKYAARDDILLSMINNHKNFDKKVDANGNTWYYFDEYIFMYNEKTQRFIKK